MTGTGISFVTDNQSLTSREGDFLLSVPNCHHYINSVSVSLTSDEFKDRKSKQFCSMIFLEACYSIILHDNNDCHIILRE